MSVLKGEGKVPILFGSTSIPGTATIRRGYLARPNMTGEWPTVVLLPSIFGISPSIKDISRRLARQGLAVVAVDLYEGNAPKRDAPKEAYLEATDDLHEPTVLQNVLDIVAFISNPAGFWSSGEHGYGVLAIGSGAKFAAPLLSARPPEGFAMAYGTQSAMVNHRLATYPGPILGIWGGADEIADLEAARRLNEDHPRTEIVIYSDVGHAFLDDSHDDYNAGAAADALERYTEFFTKLLPPPPAT